MVQFSNCDTARGPGTIPNGCKWSEPWDPQTNFESNGVFRPIFPVDVRWSSPGTHFFILYKWCSTQADGTLNCSAASAIRLPMGFNTPSERNLSRHLPLAPVGRPPLKKTESQALGKNGFDGLQVVTKLHELSAQLTAQRHAESGGEKLQNLGRSNWIVCLCCLCWKFQDL